MRRFGTDTLSGDAPDRLLLHCPREDSELSFMTSSVQRARARTRLATKVAIAKMGRDSRRLDTVVQLPKVESWRKQHVSIGTPEFATREELYRFVHDQLDVSRPISYLEFGVFEGQSMRQWVELDKHPDSRFHGFDSFRGLPEDWRRFDGKITKGHFDVRGVLPEIDDDRCSFIAGWFQHSLDGFLAGFRPAEQRVIHIDADLYSSALYVLTRLDGVAVPGTIVIFDEFSSVLNEFAALEHYCAAYMREYEVIAHAGYYFGHLAIRLR